MLARSMNRKSVSGINITCHPVLSPAKTRRRVKYNMRLEMKKKIKWIWIIGTNVYWIFFLLYRLLHCRKICAFMTGNFLFTAQSRKKKFDGKKKNSHIFFCASYFFAAFRNKHLRSLSVVKTGTHFLMKS